MRQQIALLKELQQEVRVKGEWKKGELEGMILRKIDAAARDEGRQKVGELKKYDFFSWKILEVPHPCVIFRIEGDVAWGIVTTTKEGACHSISRVEGSRQLEGSWWCNTIICQTAEYCLRNWLGIFEDGKEVDRAVRELKKYYKNILK